MPTAGRAPLRELAATLHAVTRASRWRAGFAWLALVWVVALLAARQGTARARISAAGAMGASVVLAVGWRMVERRRLREPERLLRGPARRVDRVRAERALRALSLVGADGEPHAERTSADLARLHVARVFSELPSERIIERASRISMRIGVVAVGVGVCVLGAALANAWSVLEGGDVLMAWRGVAPVTMRWLDGVELIARPPDYLHQSELNEAALSPLLLPYGTLVTVRGVPLRAGRRLLLSDGTTEIPFVEDGAGAVVARWPLTQSQTLHVIARFGEVVVSEPDALVLTSVPDDAPIVTLDGAPRSVPLVEQADDIPVKYEATDDHGLREVHLVLRSGPREERRVLAHLDGETTRDKGGYVLKLRDAFLKKSHAPVEVTVEAKDNDPLTGPKWGASAAITVIPPEVGEPEARRLDALRKFRDALVDSLAWRLDTEVPGGAAERKSFVTEEKRRADEDDRLLSETVSPSYAGIRIPTRVRAMLSAQQQTARKTVDAELRAPSAASHADVVKATEHFVLVADAVVRGLGMHDTRDSAHQLADVADDLALGASQLQSETADTRSRGGVRMDAAAGVLAGGGRLMQRLGATGRDLGEIVEADLLRVRRARDGKDFVHSELAARDLAARLRQPDPSFGARGGVRRGGGESGGARGTPGDEGAAPDDVEQAFEEAAQDLERLSQEHAGAISKIEQALAGATSEEELKEMREESKRHAEAIRQAARQLPTVGMGSDSWTSKGAAARELAEQMAKSLEQGRPDDAVQSGRSAVGSLEEAKRMLQRGGWTDDPSGDAQKRVDDARRRLDAESKWAEERLRQMRHQAADRARKQIEQGGEEEGSLADRARSLAQKGRDRGALPEQAIDSIDDAERAAREAAEALKQGAADRGLERQREAQRDLEAAREQLQGDDDEPGASQAGSSEGSRLGTSDVVIPKPGMHKGPEEFRRRVVRGLARPAGGGLKDAVQRYAEGLLR